MRVPMVERVEKFGGGTCRGANLKLSRGGLKGRPNNNGRVLK